MGTQEQMTKSVLLTGGFGNIGGRFAAHLRDQGVEGVKLSSRSNRESPPWAPSSRIVKCDLLDPHSLREAVSGTDIIFHFAALNDRDCIADPQHAYDVNVTGTHNLVDAAIESGVHRIVYMSTIHVYGSPLVGHVSESSPTIPSHPYGVTHLEAERVLTNRSASIESVILRSGNGFGYPMTFDVDIWHIIVNDLCIQAVREKRLVLRSPSNIERNFITISDICSALFHCGFKLILDRSTDTFNLGSKSSRTLREMADLVAKCCETRFGYRPSIIESVPETPQLTHLEFDSEKLISTGFRTQENFEFEIDQMLQVARSHYEK